VCSNARTVGSGSIWLLCADSKNQDVLNVMVPIKQNTTVTLPGTVRLTLKQTLQDWKPSKVNLALIHLSV